MAASTISPTPDLAEVGRRLAELQDFRLIFYVLIVIVFTMAIERALSAWGMRKERAEMRLERQEMWKVADKFTDAAKEFSEQTNKVVVELQVLRALAARVEANNGEPE